MADLGRMLVVLGVVAILVGVALIAGPRLPWLGRLPGDVVIRRDGLTLYLPIATSIVVSLALSLLLRLFGR